MQIPVVPRYLRLFVNSWRRNPYNRRSLITNSLLVCPHSSRHALQRCHWSHHPILRFLLVFLLLLLLIQIFSYSITSVVLQMCVHLYSMRKVEAMVAAVAPAGGAFLRLVLNFNFLLEIQNIETFFIKV